MADTKSRATDMRTLFAAIDQCESDTEKQVLTSLNTEGLGAKCLVAGKKIVWESNTQKHYANYFSEHPEDLFKLDISGKIRLADKDVFCDTLGNEKKLVICGGGHVSIPVIRMGRMIGCHVIVLEDRPKFADAARKAGADEVYCEAFADGLQRITGDADTYFVIVTRGHRYDEECLEQITQKAHAYIGMIGSRRRVAMVKEHLLEKGCDSAVLDEIYSPIGLNIGAETPEEIGVAIIAEIIEVKNKKKRTYGYSKEIRKAIESNTECGQKVLATIIERKGSAPQGVGVKMLICEDGTCVGTIGGGCMEAGVVQKARLLMSKAGTLPATQSQSEQSKQGEGDTAIICSVDLQNADAGEEGMVCGGSVKVLLELLTE